MNEDDFRRLVDRARDAEGEPAPVPRGLVVQVRTAARRRTRLVAAAVAGLVVVVGVAGVVGHGSGGRGVERVVDPAPVAGGADELGAHGGPCPAVLPEPVDDDGGHGFGTSTPAQEAPRLETPATAWICQYTPRTTGRTASGGRAYSWSRTATPRRIADAVLPEVAALMRSIDVGTDLGTRACTADLGPRYVLVGAVGGDLTGVSVDDYGCEEVRLSDDPFVTAPGDDQRGATVPGVLVGADDLAATLASWWDTSPADGRESPGPLVVTCTDQGPQVSSSTVSAGPAGVAVLVEDEMSTAGSYLVYTSAGPSGGDVLAEMPRPATYAFPPGPLTLGCSSPPDMDGTGTVVVDVRDPEGFWRSTTLADHGCGAGGAEASWAVGPGSGATAQEAVDDLLVLFADAVEGDAADFSAQPAETGYSGADTQTWIGLRQGTPYLAVLVTDSGATFSAMPSTFCGAGK